MIRCTLKQRITRIPVWLFISIFAALFLALRGLPLLQLNLAQLGVEKALLAGSRLSAAQPFPARADLYPGQPAMYDLRGRLVAGDVDKAATTAHRLPDTGLTRRLALPMVAEAYWAAGEAQHAVSYWQEARANLQLHGTALAAFEAGDDELAMLAWEAAVENWSDNDIPNWPEQRAAQAAYSRLALIYARRGNLDESIAAYVDLLELAPENPRIYGRIGDLYRRQGEYAAAQQWLDRGFQVEPNSDWLYYYQGRLFLSQNDNARATESFRIALRFSNQDAFRETIREALRTLEADD